MNDAWVSAIRHYFFFNFSLPFLSSPSRLNFFTKCDVYWYIQHVSLSVNTFWFFFAEILHVINTNKTKTKTKTKNKTKSKSKRESESKTNTNTNTNTKSKMNEKGSPRVFYEKVLFKIWIGSWPLSRRLRRFSGIKIDVNYWKCAWFTWDT